MAFYLKTVQSPRPLVPPFFIGDDLKHIVRIYPAIQIEVTGPELDHIKTKFKNIPIAEGDSVTWVGEMAQFIAMNF